jgi:transcriptional regulator with XRE-family HTH domain
MLTNVDPIVTNSLRKLRRAQGLPLYGLAVKASVSPTIVSMIERFDYKPGARVRERLAGALGVELQVIWPDEELDGAVSDDNARS